MVPTGNGKQGKPGKMGRHFPVREFCQYWKSQGILLKILEKSNYTGKIREKSGKFVSPKKWEPCTHTIRTFNCRTG